MHSRKLGPGGAHQKLEWYASRLEREGGKPGIVLAIRVMLDHRLDLLTRLHPDRPFPASAYLLPRPAGQNGSETGDELARERSVSGMNPPPLISPEISPMTSKTIETELLACPFCGCDRIYERGFRCFECPECRAEGPTKATKAEAVAAWNTRAALSRAPEAGRDELRRCIGRARRILDANELHETTRVVDARDELVEAEKLLAALAPPFTGGADREEIAHDLEQAWQVLPADNARAVEARSFIRSAISKLKENGLSREGLGGSARASRGAAGPSDCAEGDARRSDGGRG